MPEAFDHLFQSLGKKRSDYYQLTRLHLRYRKYFSTEEYVDITDNLPEMKALFDSYEPGAGDRLEQFLKLAQTKYQVSMDHFVYQPNQSPFDLFNWQLIKHLPALNLFGSYHNEVAKYFTHPKLLKIIEWVIMFVGCSPQNAPAVYSLMNWADWGTGVWYPEGGFGKVSESLMQLGLDLGVTYKFKQEVTSIQSNNHRATQVTTKNKTYTADLIIANADYAWVETQLLESRDQTYPSSYWDRRILSPSVLAWYVGLDTQLKCLQHHTYFADTDMTTLFDQIYTNPQWPSDPLFYVCAPTKTDPSVAPKHHENLFILIPIAPGLPDTSQTRDQLWQYVLNKLERYEDRPLQPHIKFHQSYSISDLQSDYHAYKGHGFGLANTLFQTAIWRPSIKSKKLSNLYYTGCMTVPGVGLPTSLISGQVVANYIVKENKAI